MDMRGNCAINPRVERLKHYGMLGIALKDGYRDAGIGQEMMKEIEKHAPRLRIEYLGLDVFSVNDRAIHVYEKLGYRKTGTYPDGVRYKGGYVDDVIMTKKLD